ncbi:mitochondrial membrane protein [Cystobasidiomycetes sp. EMM_F5]
MVTRRVAAGKGQDEQGNDASTSHSQSGSGSSSSQLPYAVDATMSLSPEELGVLQEQYMAEQDKGYVSTQTKFNLAWGLVRSENSDRVKDGISLLMDIYESEPPRRRECLYYLSLGHYKLKNYTEAKKFIDKLLSKEPNNMQAQSLSGMVDADVQKEGLIGMAIAGGAVAIIGAITVAAVKRLARR